MISNQGYIDGSWKLKVVSEDLKGVILLTVFNNTVLEEVINQISEYFKIRKDQTKYFGCWCPSKNVWLFKTEYTLHQLCLNANTVLIFMKKIRQINIQLTNKSIQKFYVDFSIPSLCVLNNLCLEIGVENFQNFSLMKSQRKCDIIFAKRKKSLVNKLVKSPLTASLKNLAANYSSSKRLSRNLGSNCPWTPTSGYGSMNSTMNSLENFNGSCFSIINYNDNGCEMINERYNHYEVGNFQFTSCENNFDRSKFNKDWIFLSKSLMEQSINEHYTLQVRLKSFVLHFDDEHISDELLDFYYEQMKNSILCGKIEVEMNLALVLASLQYQIFLLEKKIDTYNNSNNNVSITSQRNARMSLADEIDIMLSNLEKELLIDSFNVEDREKVTFRIDYFVNIRQIFPIKSLGKFIRMKLKLIKDHINIFSETNLSQPKYEFYIKHCRFLTEIGMNRKGNLMFWTFENNKRLTKIEMQFFNDEDFIAIYVFAVAHSNVWRPVIKQYSECEKSIKRIINILRSSEESKYNIFNMPRMELNELLGCRVGKKEMSGKYLKLILQYNCKFKNITLHQAKALYLRFSMNIPGYNYHYFFVQILEPSDFIGPTVVALNEETFMIFDSETISLKRFVLPWTALKSWSINTELQKLDLFFHRQFISLTVNNCSAVCFHECISTFIWFAKMQKTSDKIEHLKDFLNLLNLRT